MVKKLLILKKLLIYLINIMLMWALILIKKLPKSLKKFYDYLRNLQVEKSFFLKPVVKQEIIDIILAFDNKTSLGPNSIPIYILEISNNLFSDLLTEIVNLSFKTGIFPDLCKLSKIISIFKKDDPMFCVNYRPISLLPIYSKIFEKLIYRWMYSFLNCNNLIYDNPIWLQGQTFCKSCSYQYHWTL